MGGSVLFQDALKARLDLIKPSKQNFVDCLRERPATLSDGAGGVGWFVWGVLWGFGVVVWWWCV